jgi:LysR family transcriptional activator of glutamate synthase operon
MDLRQLECFLAVAEEGHFTRAAARLHLAQSAVSQRIAKLEQELGIPLLERTTRSVRLTGAGVILAERARGILSDLRAARDELANYAGISSGRLTVGASQTMGPVDLSALLSGFHRMYPNVELIVREGLSVDLAGALAEGDLDLAFTTLSAGERDTQLRSHRVASESLVAVVSRTDRLASRRSVRLGELRDRVFVSFRPGATIRRQIEDVALQEGFAPRIGFETNDVVRMRSLVAHGLGVAVMPRSDAEQPGPSTSSVTLADGGLTFEVFVSWRASRSMPPAAAKLLDALLADETSTGDNDVSPVARRAALPPGPGFSGQ